MAVDRKQQMKEITERLEQGVRESCLAKSRSSAMSATML